MDAGGTRSVTDISFVALSAGNGKALFNTSTTVLLVCLFFTENYTKLSPIAGVVLKPPMGPNTLEDYVQISPLNISLLQYQYYFTPPPPYTLETP